MGDTIGIGRSVRICIDPGHGGFDSGGSGNGLIEKEQTLAVSLKLAALLRSEGHAVFLTRRTDAGLGNTATQSLKARAKMSVDKNSDLFVSVHFDAGGSSAFRGCSAFGHWGGTRENKRPFPQGADLATRLAESVHGRLNIPYAPYEGQPGGMHWFRLGVFRYSQNAVKVTAALVEIAALTSPKDAAIVKQPGFHAEAAFAIACGIHKHLGLPEPGEPSQPETTPVKIITHGTENVIATVNMVSDGDHIHDSPGNEKLYVTDTEV